MKHYNPRDCYARLHAIRDALRKLEDASSRLRFAWDAETLRVSPHLADCCLRVEPATSAAALEEAQAAFHAALLALREETARDVVVVESSLRPRGSA